MSNLNSNELKLFAVAANNTSVCLGKVYKAQISHFMGSRGEIVDKLVFRPQKRKSCPGCKYCDYLEDDVHEALACGTFLFPKDAQHGKLYRLGMINVSSDYETGIIDSWDTTFILVE